MTPYVTTTLQLKWTDQATDSPAAPPYIFFGDIPLPYYRFTPPVAAWFDRKMGAAEERMAAGDADGAALRTALVASGALATYLSLRNWAEDAYGEAAIAAAVAGLPPVVPPPPRDVPPVDPLVWSGAFDAPAVGQKTAAPALAPTPPPIVVQQIAAEWGDAQPRRVSVAARAAPRKRKGKVATSPARGGLFS